MSDPTPSQPKHKAVKAGISVGILAVFLVLAILALVLGVKVSHRNTQIADLQKQLTDAKALAAKEQSDLDSASSASDDLKTQLAKATSAQADLKAQVDQASVAASQQQALIDRDKALQADLQSRLDKSEIQSAAFKSQLNEATAGSARMLTELDQSKIQALDLQEKLHKAEADIAQLQPLLLKAHHMPVTAVFEKTHGDRYTLHVNNLDQQPVTVNLTIVDAGKTRSQSNVIGAGATLNVEKLAAGDNVTVASDGYDPLTLTVE
jgi:hypothetical protein